MNIILPWNENIDYIGVEPTDMRHGFSPVYFQPKIEWKQNFIVLFCFKNAVVINNKEYDRVECLYDCTADEVIATYCSGEKERRPYYPQSAKKFFKALHILSAPENELTHEEWIERKEMAKP